MNPNQILWALIVTAPFAFADNTQVKRVAVVTAVGASACLHEIEACVPLRAGTFIENNALIDVASGVLSLYDFTRHSRLQLTSGQHRIIAESMSEDTSSAVQRRLQRLLTPAPTASAAQLQRGDTLPAECSVDTLFANRPAWLDICLNIDQSAASLLPDSMPAYSFYRQWPILGGSVVAATASFCGPIQSLGELHLAAGEPVYLLTQAEGRKVTIGLAKPPELCLNGLDDELAVLDTLSARRIPFEENLARAALLEARGLRYEASQALQPK